MHSTLLPPTESWSGSDYLPHSKNLATLNTDSYFTQLRKNLRDGMEEIHREKSAFHSCWVSLLGNTQCSQFLKYPSRDSSVTWGWWGMHRKEGGLAKPDEAFQNCLQPHWPGCPRHTKLHPPHSRITPVVGYCFQCQLFSPPAWDGGRAASTTRVLSLSHLDPGTLVPTPNCYRLTPTKSNFGSEKFLS